MVSDCFSADGRAALCNVRLSATDNLPTLFADTMLLLAFHHKPDSRGLAAARADKGQSIERHRGFPTNHAALLIRPRAPLKIRGQVELLNEGGPLRRHDPQDFATLATVLPIEHRDGIAFPQSRHQTTSGASEMIFINCRSRRSRATGPNTRVRGGFRWGSIRTTALESNRNQVPSDRRSGAAVRTTTARTTSPFFTMASGSASRTFPVITSPTGAVRLFDRPMTPMHNIFLTPVLSATASRVRMTIICPLAPQPAEPAQPTAARFESPRSSASACPSTTAGFP